MSVDNTKALTNYDYGGGIAMEVLAILVAIAIVALIWTPSRLLTPAGWLRVGGTLYTQRPPGPDSRSRSPAQSNATDQARP
jgi:hypothetical protein